MQRLLVRQTLLQHVVPELQVLVEGAGLKQTRLVAAQDFFELSDVFDVEVGVGDGLGRLRSCQHVHVETLHHLHLFLVLGHQLLTVLVCPLQLF